MVNILDLIAGETGLQFVGKGDKEYKGACPFCGGNDRFCVWPVEGRYWCRVCNAKGDAIQFARDYLHLSFREACSRVGETRRPRRTDRPGRTERSRPSDKPLQPPTAAWVAQAQPFILSCQAALWSDAGKKALTWLRDRCLSDDTIRGAGLGYNAHDHYVKRDGWGLAPEIKDGRSLDLWLPRGIVIPWTFRGGLVGLRIRRPEGDPKYWWIKGGTSNMLYNADAIMPGQPVVVAEGEFDALTVGQAGYIGVATGSTNAARVTRWIARLATASVALVAYDNDPAGDKAARWWTGALPNAKRRRPYWKDINKMAQDGADVAAWIAAGLPKQAEVDRSSGELPEAQSCT